MISKGDRVGGGEDRLGIWDGNVIKLGCDDNFSTINVIKFTEVNKREKEKKQHTGQVPIYGSKIAYKYQTGI